jgi:hypothetical protein
MPKLKCPNNSKLVTAGLSSVAEWSSMLTMSFWNPVAKIKKEKPAITQGHHLGLDLGVSTVTDCFFSAVRAALRFAMAEKSNKTIRIHPRFQPTKYDAPT